MGKDFFFIFAKIFDEFSQWIASKVGPDFEKSSIMVQNWQKTKGLFNQSAEIKLISKKILTQQSSSRFPNKTSGSANIKKPSTWAFFKGSM